MIKKGVRSVGTAEAEAIDVESSFTLDELLTQEYGLPGTEKRENAEAEIEVMRLMLNLKEMRKKEKIKLKTVSKRMGVDDSVVSKLENQNKDLQLGTLVRYVRSLSGHLSLNISIGNSNEIVKLI